MPLIHQYPTYGSHSRHHCKLYNARTIGDRPIPKPVVQLRKRSNRADSTRHHLCNKYRHQAADDNTQDALDIILVDGGVKLNRLEDLLHDIGLSAGHLYDLCVNFNSTPSCTSPNSNKLNNILSPTYAHTDMRSNNPSRIYNLPFN